MSVLRKLLWWKRSTPVQRVRICVECGMPVAEHREWCSILRTMQAMDRNSKGARSAG